MVNLIVGTKGTGKTKKLIDAINNALENSKGNVVAIEKGSNLRYDVTHKVRLVDMDEFYVDGYFSLYGFLGGLCAGNYDITDIFVDDTFKVCGNDMEELEIFIKKVNPLMEKTNTNIFVTISADESSLTQEIKENANLI